MTTDQRTGRVRRVEDRELVESTERTARRFRDHLKAHEEDDAGMRRAIWIAVALSLMALAIAGFGSYFAYDAAIRASHNASRLDSASRGACKRVQAQRERSNVSDARQFLILHTAGGNPNNRAAIQRAFGEYARTTQYGPPTDCPRAVIDPVHYQPPAYLPFGLLGVKYARRVIHAAAECKQQPVPRAVRRSRGHAESLPAPWGGCPRVP